MTTVETLACTARRHGTASAARNNGCTCSSAKEELRLYKKRMRSGRPETRMVPAVGPMRQLRALALDRWGAEQIAARVGCNVKTVRRIRGGEVEAVQVAIASRIAAVTAQLAGTWGPDHRPAFVARRAGWWPLDAWFDIYTDPEPSTVDEFAVMHAVAGDLRWDQLGEQEQHLAVAELTGRGWSDMRIADHLRTGHSRVARVRNQLGIASVPTGARRTA